MGQSLESHYRQSDRRDITHLQNLFGGMFGPEGRIRAKEAMLLDEGFSRDDIVRIKKVSPELKINVIQPMRGQTLAKVASCALEMFQMNHAPVVFKFNGTMVLVQENDSLRSITVRLREQTQPDLEIPLDRHQQPHL